jgi:hypothetical protein
MSKEDAAIEHLHRARCIISTVARSLRTPHEDDEKEDDICRSSGDFERLEIIGERRTIAYEYATALDAAEMLILQGMSALIKPFKLNLNEPPKDND